MMGFPVKHDQNHIIQARHNDKLLKEDCFPDPCTTSLLTYKDWNATIAFYLALHYVECYLHQNGFRAKFKNHRDRNDYLKVTASRKDTNINKIVNDYISLYKLSRQARYTPCHFNRIHSSDLCKYARFACEELPKILGFS